MGENWFFRWIWRFNALGIAALLIVAGFGIANMLFGTSITTIIGPIDQGQDDDRRAGGGADLQLRMAATVEGTDVILFSLGEKFFEGGSFARRPAVANYLFYNAKDGSSRWLFSSNSQEITEIDLVWDDGTAAESQPILPSTTLPGSVGKRRVRALAFDVRPPSGSGAKRYDLYICRPDGSEVTKLIDGADEVSTFTPVGADAIVIANRRGGHAYATTFSLVDFKQVLETDLSKQILK
jgi:hypothetical protein